MIELPADISYRQSRTLSLWEEHIQRNLDHERLTPRSKLQRFRRCGKEILHSRVLLLTVIALNCLDCLMVLSELVLDVYFIKEMIVTAENTMETFNQLLKDTYPEVFGGFHVHDTHKFYNKILLTRYICHENTSIEANSTLYRTVRSAVATLFKFFCHGLSFVRHKLEVFDSIVVIASFTLDVCYIKGLTNYPVESFVLILVIMIPWRIIRVLNSLVIAVKDNFHFLLKLMYKKNKYLREKIENLETQRAQQQNIIDVLTEMCNTYGVTDQQMIDSLASSSKRKQTKVLPFRACLKRQVSFEDDEMTAKVWEALPCLIESRDSLPGQPEKDISEDNI